MDISFLVPNIGGPSLGFATAYARALAERWPVRVIGPDLWGGGVMPMYRGCFDYTVVPAPRLYRFPDFIWESKRLSRAATGDVIFAVKATPQTVWVALREKRRRGCKVVVCLDEWDGALMARRSPPERRTYWRRHWMHPTEENYYPWVERLLPHADRVVSTSHFLQRKFGGVVVRMGVDTDRFKPLEPSEKTAVRAELGLNEGQPVIVFGGVVRPHKGVELILEAIARTGDPRLRLLVVGPITDALSALMDGPMGKYIVATGTKAAVEMPRWLGAGDMAVLPMSDDLLAQSQVPCKVYEAMAVGLPVAAGAVSDLPEIVAGAGETFPAGDAAALACILRRWSMDPEKTAAYGSEARRRCLERFSFAVMGEELIAVVEGLADGEPALRKDAGPVG
ncbi:MAG: glycosyltransferase family 4 protein [Kiritimatiellia bacterium]